MGTIPTSQPLVAVVSKGRWPLVSGTGYTVVILERCDIIGNIMNKIVIAAVGYVYNW